MPWPSDDAVFHRAHAASGTVEAGRWDSMLRRMYAQLAREQGQTMAE